MRTCKILWWSPAVLMMTLGSSGYAHEIAHPETSDADQVQSINLTFDKAEQRRFGIRTQRISAPLLAVEAPARIAVDPRHRVLLAADQAGIVEAPSRGFINVGEVVRAGEILATLRPVLPTPEQRDLETDLAYAHRDVELGKTQIKRYGIDMAQKFDVKLPTPSIQVVLDYRTAEARAEQYSGAITHDILLRAPADGVVLNTSLRRGAAVSSGDPLIELTSERPAAVELLISDPDLDSASASQARTDSGQRIDLHFLSESFDPVKRLRHAFYAMQSVDKTLSLGEPVWVSIPRVPAHGGFWDVPVASVVEEHGKSWLWVHDHDQHFVAHSVSTLHATDGFVQVHGALNDDDRIVVDGAAVLQQRAHEQLLQF